jgi:hypothetical protein
MSYYVARFKGATGLYATYRTAKSRSVSSDVNKATPFSTYDGCKMFCSGFNNDFEPVEFGDTDGKGN